MRLPITLDAFSSQTTLLGRFTVVPFPIRHHRAAGAERDPAHGFQRVAQALTNKPITIFGKGTQTRSFCYYADLIEGIYRLMMSDYDLPITICP